MTLGERMKQLREERSLTQERFADCIGVSKSAVGMYETNKREPNLETLDTIADYFNVDMEYLRGKSDCRNKYQSIHFANASQIPNGFIPINEKEPAAGISDEQTKELNTLFSQLSDDQQKLILSQLRGIVNDK